MAWGTCIFSNKVNGIHKTNKNHLNKLQLNTLLKNLTKIVSAYRRKKTNDTFDNK